MRIDILTLFPEMIEGVTNSSIIKRAIEKNLISIFVHDFREYSNKQNKRVDDYSYGGGAGMIIEVQPIVDCLRSIKGFDKAKKVLTNPSGIKYTQQKALELSKEDHLIIIAGHYEGIDDRITNYIDEEISIGDYILTGGEIASMVIVDSIIRLIPGVLGNNESIDTESFDDDLLEYPQYTRPVIFEGHAVPEVLVSGNHEKIRAWRHEKALEKTYKNRPDLLEKKDLSRDDKEYLLQLKKGENQR